MAKKVLRINKGPFQFEVDADFIAMDRANHYADTDADTTYQEEYDFTIGDDFELEDWFSNNMNWSDVPVDRRRILPITMPESPDDRMLEDFDTENEVLEVK